MAFLEQLRANLRPQDLLDVLIVAVLLYWVISWVRRSRSRFVMTGFAVAAGLYVAARSLQLHLTESIYHAAVPVALLALVVIFQEDFRRAFERIALARGPLRRASRVGGGLLVDTVVESVETLARQRTGALVVFKGKEPLERHVTGGVPLHGRVSPPLLYSIFDASSPGHDGAVLIAEGQASRFGVHLPLSTNLRGDERFGTRHTAALGLSERSDAFVVVVSEERGSISVAQQGRLEAVDAAALRDRLSAFLGSIAVEGGRAWWHGALTRNLGAKAVALVLAVGSWVVVIGQQSRIVAQSYDLPVVLAGTREDLQVEEPRPAGTRVTLTGSSRAFQEIRPGDLAVRLDIRNLGAGTQRLAIRDSDIELPAGLRVTGLQPRFITVVAHETVTQEVPVRVETTGRLGAGLRLRSVSPEPERVPVVLRRGDGSRVGTVRTEAVDLTDIRETTRLSRRLLVPTGAQPSASTPTEVRVTIEVVPSQPRPPGPTGGGV